MRIKNLPAILQININRFGVSPRGEMIKINSRCEFGDFLDFDKIMEGTDSYQLSQTSDRISSYYVKDKPTPKPQNPMKCVVNFEIMGRVGKEKNCKS